MALDQQNQISLQTLWDGIQHIKTDMLTHLDSKVDPIQTKLSIIQMSLDTLGEHVSSLEQRIGANKDNLQDLLTLNNKELTKVPVESSNCLISTTDSISCKNETIIFGDFNKNWLDKSSVNEKNYFEKLNLAQLIKELT